MSEILPTAESIQRQLAESEERFRLLIGSVSDYAIFMLDQNGCVCTWNPGAERIKGYREAEVIGRHFSLFYPQDEIKKAETALLTASAEGKWEDEGFRIRKDGERFWASVVITPVYDSLGILHGFAKVTRDMTARREMEEELRRLNSQLEEFAYTVSHDLRAPLRNIAATSRMLLEDAGPELSVGNRSLLENQIRSANKLGQIISDLLTLSRISRTEIAMRPLDLTELAKDVTGSVFEAEVDPHRVDIEEGLRAMGDATLVYVVLLNLFENARKFSPRGGTVSFGRAQGSDENTFVVRDEGVGFPMEYAGKVFQPFQRLVGEGEFEGTGIGLANVQRAIERHGGHVWVESQPGKGSCFYFTLPFVQEGQA